MSTKNANQAMKVGLIAGGGDLPLLIMQRCMDDQIPFFILAIEGQTPQGLLKCHDHAWVSFGAVNQTLKLLHANDVTHIVMAGHMKRPSFSSLKPDAKGLQWLSSLAFKWGDNHLLKALIQLMEGEGFQVLSPQDILHNTPMPSGTLSAVQPDPIALQDIERGRAILNALSAYDVGQAVVVQQGFVLGIEAVEGTDELMARAGMVRREGLGGVLIKLPKCGQDSRADLPVVGPKTVFNAHNAGLRGIAMDGLLIHQDEVKKLADQYGLFIIGITND